MLPNLMTLSFSLSFSFYDVMKNMVIDCKGNLYGLGLVIKEGPMESRRSLDTYLCVKFFVNLTAYERMS